VSVRLRCYIYVFGLFSEVFSLIFHLRSSLIIPQFHAESEYRVTVLHLHIRLILKHENDIVEGVEKQIEF
jgi:hypothetical protein